MQIDQKPEQVDLQNNFELPEQSLPSISSLIRTNSFVDRYFKRYYTPLDCPVQQYLYLHTNGIVLVGVTQSQAAHFGPQFTISFDCISKVTADLVKGKKKKGGIKVGARTWIAEVIWKQEAEQKRIPIRGLIEGFIIEFNEDLVKNPQWLKQEAEQKGYFVIMIPRGHIDPLKIGMIQKS